jgi:hypothetical protein
MNTNEVPKVGNRVRVISGAHSGKRGKVRGIVGDRVTVYLDNADVGTFDSKELVVIRREWVWQLFFALFYAVAGGALVYLLAKGLAQR